MFQHDVTISDCTGYKIPITTKYLLEISEESDVPAMHQAFIFAQENNIPLLFLSGGTNILFSKKYFPGIIVKNQLLGWKYEDQILTTFSGERIWKIAETLSQSYAQPIWERFIGLPGTIAGAINGNAGCFGLEANSNFSQALLYDISTGKSRWYTYEEMQFDYRSSVVKTQKNIFIVQAKFDLSTVREKYANTVDVHHFRTVLQPQGRSCGSFFKNPSSDISAGMLIEQVGLKGFRHGGAFWSDIHANFLMADEQCSAQDLLELVTITQKKVKEETGFDLINEVCII